MLLLLIGLLFMMFLLCEQKLESETFRPYYDFVYPSEESAYTQHQLTYKHPHRKYPETIFDKGIIYPFDQALI